MTADNVSAGERPRKQPADQDGDRVTVFAFDKNTREKVVASLSNYRGETYLDLRVFFEADGGRYLPTKKGVTLALDCLDDLERAVQALRAAVEARGLAA
jgi:hypothetical protein